VLVAMERAQSHRGIAESLDDVVAALYIRRRRTNRSISEFVADGVL
jgi:hypothetical protein